MDGTVLTDAEDEALVADAVTAAAASNNEHDHDKSAPTCEEVSSRSIKTSPSSTSSNLVLLLQRRHALAAELSALDEQIRQARANGEVEPDSLLAVDGDFFDRMMPYLDARPVHQQAHRCCVGRGIRQGRLSV